MLRLPRSLTAIDTEIELVFRIALGSRGVAQRELCLNQRCVLLGIRWDPHSIACSMLRKIGITRILRASM